jgi:hypothetical protein
MYRGPVIDGKLQFEVLPDLRPPALPILPHIVPVSDSGFGLAMPSDLGTKAPLSKKDQK